MSALQDAIDGLNQVFEEKLEAAKSAASQFGGYDWLVIDGELRSARQVVVSGPAAEYFAEYDPTHVITAVGTKSQIVQRIQEGDYSAAESFLGLVDEYSPRTGSDVNTVRKELP